MSLYLTIFGVLAFFSLVEILGLKRRDSMLLFGAFVLLFFVLSFIRWETGTDWEAYYGFFRWSGDWAAESVFEPGFFALNTLVKQFTENYTVLLCIEAALIATFTALAIKRFSAYPLTSMLILYAILLANIMFVRQAIATAMLFYAARYIIERRKLPFFLMVLLATMTHRSSVVFLLAWPVFYLRWSILKMSVWLLVAVAISSVIGTLIQSLGGMFGGIIQAKIDLYLGEGSEGNTFGAGFSMVQIIIKGLINKVFLFAIGAYVITYIDSEKYPNVRGFMNLFWFGSIIYFLAIPVSTGMARFSYAFDIFQVVLIPYLFVVFRDVWWRIALFFLVASYLLMRLIVYLNNFYDLYVPFKTFLDA